MCGQIKYTLSSISIHALVKRATWCRLGSENVTIDFNPRPREEGDQYADNNRGGYCDFNPRPREEGDSFHIVGVLYR